VTAPEPRARALGLAIARGLVGRCPACGKRAILQGYIRPAPRCRLCGEDLSPCQTADSAPYIVTFLVGLIFTPIVLVLASNERRSDWVIAAILAAAVVTALALLPRAKGASLGLLWALRVRNA
jgi:uncharacterized protein (DUF983 family)